MKDMGLCFLHDRLNDLIAAANKLNIGEHVNTLTVGRCPLRFLVVLQHLVCIPALPG